MLSWKNNERLPLSGLLSMWAFVFASLERVGPHRRPLTGTCLTQRRDGRLERRLGRLIRLEPPRREGATGNRPFRQSRKARLRDNDDADPKPASRLGGIYNFLGNSLRFQFVPKLPNQDVVMAVVAIAI